MSSQNSSLGRNKPRQRCLGFELLEDRRVMAILTANFNAFSDPGETVIVSESNLSASDTKTNDPSELVYFLSEQPKFGELELRGHKTHTFTQADVNNGDVSYTNNLHTTSLVDSFSFTVRRNPRDTLITEIATKIDNQKVAIGGMFNFNGTLFFTSSDSQYNVKLWKSDGTAAGTSIVAVHSLKLALRDFRGFAMKWAWLLKT